MDTLTPALPEQWREAITRRVPPERLAQLSDFLARERATAPVFPPAEDVFTALRRTQPDTVKVVLLGQDPYHGPGEAHGLSFSVRQGVKVPPSLRNIFKELEADLGIAPPGHGNLEAWADQGVLLLNAVLTVRQDAPGSHRGQGWEEVTGAVLQALCEQPHRIVFILLGKDAQKRAERLDTSRHAVLTAPHPSPLSSHAGFFGSRLFSRANAALVEAGRAPVDWRIAR